MNKITIYEAFDGTFSARLKHATNMNLKRIIMNAMME